MYLFKAKQAARDELDRACAENGVTLAEVEAFLAKHPRFGHSLRKPDHRYAGGAADLVNEVAPYITQNAAQRLLGRVKKVATAARATAPKVAATARAAWADRADLLARAREDLAVVAEVLEGKIGEEWLAIGRSMLKRHEEAHEPHREPIAAE
jgi:hypothetical protein